MKIFRIAFLCSLMLLVMFQCDFCETNPAYVAFEHCVDDPTNGCWEIQGTVMANEMNHAEGTPVNYEKLVKKTPVPTQPPTNPPACVPPVPAIDKVTAFCANLRAKMGGASFVISPGQSNNQPFFSGWADNEESGASCQSASDSEEVCTGKPGSTMQVMVCSQCSLFSYAPSSQDVVCANGSVMAVPGEPSSGCNYVGPTPDPNAPSQFYLCPTGSHYDNTQQNCVDDRSGNVVTGGDSSNCPAGYAFYDLWSGLCSKERLHIYNCQYFSVPIGDCLTRKITGSAPCQPSAVTHCP